MARSRRCTPSERCAWRSRSDRSRSARDLPRGRRHRHRRARCGRAAGRLPPSGTLGARARRCVRRTRSSEHWSGPPPRPATRISSALCPGERPSAVRSLRRTTVGGASGRQESGGLALLQPQRTSAATAPSASRRRPRPAMRRTDAASCSWTSSRGASCSTHDWSCAM